MRYSGMVNDVTQYFSSGLSYLNTIEIGTGIWYQVYVNPNFIYNANGAVANPLVESTWQKIVVQDAFNNVNLLGKVVKV